MANAPAVTFNEYLQLVIGIQDNAVRTALRNQGLTNFDDFTTLTEEDVEEICSNVRKPGGMMANPNYNAGVQNQPLVIANPGVPLGHIYEKRLKILRSYMFHLQRIQRLPFDSDVTTLQDLSQIYLLKDLDKGEDNLTLPVPFVRVDTARVMLEDLDDYLGRKRGETGVPLSYVVRKDVALPTDMEDPGMGQPSYLEEMIRRASHAGSEWQTDNLAVWNILRHITHGGPAWNWVSQYQRQGNGRDAYLALKTHYLGASAQERIRSQADAKLDGAFYDGRNRNFSFENYCGLLNNAFADLESTGESVDESRKLRYFIEDLGILTTQPPEPM